MGKTIALLGQENCGKTTLINRACGIHLETGNWPGVSVRRQVGEVRSRDMKVVDLPGIYSLAPHSAEEIVSRNFLLQGKFDVIVNVVDATHLEHSLSLTAELVHFHRPMVIAVNMIDLAKKANLELNLDALSKVFGVPVVPISAATGEGIDTLLDTVERARVPQVNFYSPKLAEAVAHVSAELAKHANMEGINAEYFEFTALSLLQQDAGCLREFKGCDSLLNDVNRQKAEVEATAKTDIENLIAKERYDFVDKTIKACAQKKDNKANAFTQAVDKIVLNRWLAIPLFLFFIFVIYDYAVNVIGFEGTVFVIATVFGEWVNNAAVAAMAAIDAPSWLSGLVIDGIVGGVGAVLGFVPQMAVLFLCLTFLEQCGYMTRVAFALDRIFRHFGLSGRCCFNLIVSSACAVPAIMGTSSINNINERRITAMTTSFIPCGAKLPILIMIASAFFPGNPWIAPAMYVAAFILIAVSGFILKKQAAFNEEVSPFVMEMPNYTLPGLRSVLHGTWVRCRAFIYKAGTIIFTTIVVIWFLSNFGFLDGVFGMVEIKDSFLANIGNAIYWIFIPVGFASWEVAVAVFTGLLAKENVVGTLAVLLGVGAVAEDDAGLAAALQGQFDSDAAALGFLMFNLFSIPCIASLAAIRRALGSTRLFWFTVAFMLSLAYSLALIVYGIGGWVTNQIPFGASTIAAFAVIAGVLFFILRPARKGRSAITIPSRQI